MFKNTYQSGFLSILYSIGSKPLQIWDKTVRNGHIKRITDQDIQSSVLEIVGTNVSTNYITCPANPKRAEIASKKNAGQATQLGGIASKRGMARRGFSEQVATPLELIRPRPGGLIGGPAAYYINPRGATIREVLIISPNGAPMIHNGRDRGNSDMYQTTMRARGFEYIGPLLTEEGVARLVEVIEANLFDYTLDLKEQIFDVELDIENSDRPEQRDGQRKRRIQLVRLLEQAQKPLDGPRMVAEYLDVVKAQKLAAIPADIRQAVILMGGTAAETDKKISAMVDQLTGGKRVSGNFGSGDAAASFSATTSNAQDSDDF